DDLVVDGEPTPTGEVERLEDVDRMGDDTRDLEIPAADLVLGLEGTPFGEPASASDAPESSLPDLEPTTMGASAPETAAPDDLDFIMREPQLDAGLHEDVSS